MRRVIVKLASIGVVALLVLAYFAPHLTLHAMHRAAVRGDAAALARHVDFPAVRAHAKAQFAQAAGERLGGDGSGGWRDFGAALAASAAAPAIDALISEQTLTGLFAGRGLMRQARATWLPSNDAAASPPPAAWHPTVGYTDLSTFTARFDLDGDPDKPVVLVFKRHRGLWWKLTAVELPRLP
jgi:hypothetical protein